MFMVQLLPKMCEKLTDTMENATYGMGTTKDSNLVHPNPKLK